MSDAPSNYRHGLYLIRRSRLKRLIEQRFDNDVSRLAKEIAWPQDTIERFFCAGLQRRNIPDPVAREIETKIKLGNYWLDGEDEAMRANAQTDGR